MNAVTQQEEMEMIEEVIEMMGSIPMFDKVASGQLRIIAAHMDIIQLHARGLLFSEGHNSDYMCFVVAGTLEVLKQSDNGKRVKVSTLSRGRSIGEMALLDTFPRSATVIAETECTLLTISRDSFDKILERHPRAGISFLKSIARVLSLHLRRASGQLADAS